MTIVQLANPKPGTRIRIALSHTLKSGYNVGLDISVFEEGQSLPQVTFPIEWMLRGQAIELLIGQPLDPHGPAGTDKPTPFDMRGA
jgi:hypothetical protein